MGLFSGEDLTESEKINFIYKKLKAEQRMSQFKAFALILIIMGAYFLVQFLAKPESEPLKKKAMLFAQEKIATFVSPIVSGILDAVMKDMAKKTQPSVEGNGQATTSGTVEQGAAPSDVNSISPHSIVGEEQESPARTRNTPASQTVSGQELPNIGGVQITPEMLDAVQNSMSK